MRKQNAAARRLPFQCLPQMGRINGQLRADKPNVQTIQSAAALLNAIDQAPYEGFGPGTETLKSRTKPELYRDGPKVRELAERLGVNIRYNAQVTDIELNGGTFVAAHLSARDAEGQRLPAERIQARTCVLAAGGFESNREWLRARSS